MYSIMHIYPLVSPAAINGQLKEEHMVTLHTIYEQLYARLPPPLSPPSVSSDVASEGQDTLIEAPASPNMTFEGRHYLNGSPVSSNSTNESQDELKEALDVDNMFINDFESGNNVSCVDEPQTQQFLSKEPEATTTTTQPNNDPGEMDAYIHLYTAASIIVLCMMLFTCISDAEFSAEQQLHASGGSAQLHVPTEESPVRGRAQLDVTTEQSPVGGSAQLHLSTEQSPVSTEQEHSKLNRLQQQARSKVENEILESVRKDLKYFKESMSTNLPSKNKPRESLPPSINMKPVAKERGQRSKASFGNLKRSNTNANRDVNLTDENRKSTISPDPVPVRSHDMSNSMDTDPSTKNYLSGGEDLESYLDDQELSASTRVSSTTSPQLLSTVSGAQAKRNPSGTYDPKRATSHLLPKVRQESHYKRVPASPRSPAQVGQVTFPEFSQKRNSVVHNALRSRTLQSNGRLSTPERPQFTLDFMKEIGDVMSLVESINVRIFYTVIRLLCDTCSGESHYSGK